MMNNPKGWSVRYAAALERDEERLAKAAKNLVRLLHIQKTELASQLAAKTITRDEHNAGMRRINSEQDAAGKALAEQEGLPAPVAVVAEAAPVAAEPAAEPVDPLAAEVPADAPADPFAALRGKVPRGKAKA